MSTLVQSRKTAPQKSRKIISQITLNLGSFPLGQKAKCHGGLDAASAGELLGGLATVPEMFRKAERGSDRQDLCPHEPGCLRVEPIEIFFSYFHKCFIHGRMTGRGGVMPRIDRSDAGSASVFDELEETRASRR